MSAAQLACFGVNMQTHGAVTRPYDFDRATVDLYRTYCQIHYGLLPYLQEQAEICSTANTPLMRHLFLHYPDDRQSRHVEDQYFLGEDLLIAPVMERADSRDVYLPPGLWRDLYTGRHYTGGLTLAAYPARYDGFRSLCRRRLSPDDCLRCLTPYPRSSPA